jgi:hypothetical protein
MPEARHVIIITQVIHTMCAYCPSLCGPSTHYHTENRVLRPPITGSLRLRIRIVSRYTGSLGFNQCTLQLVAMYFGGQPRPSTRLLPYIDRLTVLNDNI